jgi:signal transduction histidine kinase
MTLHEVIEQVLQTNGKPMSTSEIAEIINNKHLYIRKDNIPIQATQIAARVGNYPNLFTRDNGKINLTKNDFATLLFQKVRNNLVHNFSEHRITNTIMPFELLKKGIFELLDINDDENLVHEPVAIYGQNKASYEAKLEALYKLCHWYLLQESHSSRNNYGILNDGLINLLAKINWFDKHNNTIITDSYFTNYFLFKILKENSDSVFTLVDNSVDNYMPREIKKFNEFLIGIYNNYFINEPIIKYESLKTEIIFPPLGFRSLDSTCIEFAEILNEITTKQKKLDKAMLLVAIGSLTSSRKNHIEARKIITESNYLDTIVELPSGVVENTGVKMVLLLFDFKRNSQDKIFFVDASNLQLIDLFNVAETINNKNSIKEYSIEVSTENIISDNYNLLPTRYLYNTDSVEIREGYEVFTLGQILTDKKTVRNLNQRKSNFYSGGEYKLIRNSDADQLATENLNLVKGGLAISAINQNVKSNVLPENENFVIGNFIHWLKPNSAIVSDEYLAKELLQPYVLKQFNLYTSGSSHIPLLRLNDLLKVQVQIPSLEIQKELLLNELRNKDAKQRKTDTISDRELDFIKTLKHALKQPTAGLGNDFASLKHFLNDKITSQQMLATEETIVPIFEDDSPETIERYTLASTLARMERSLDDIDYILEQAVQLITIASPNKKEVDLKSILSQVKTEYPKVTIKVSGGITKLLADESQLKIALHNLIDNAIKHGFKDLKVNPIIWLEIIKKDKAYIELSIRNNGKALPPEFTIDDFLAKGKSSKADVGSGFGGFLIGQIIKNHKGNIELNNNVGNEILPHNVEFIISLPR